MNFEIPSPRDLRAFCAFASASRILASTAVSGFAPALHFASPALTSAALT